MVSILLTEPVSAAPSMPDVKAALLTTAEAKRISGTPDPLMQNDWNCWKGGGPKVGCSRNWAGDDDSSLTPAQTQIDRYSSTALAATAFHFWTREFLAQLAELGTDARVVTSTPSTLVYFVGPGLEGPPYYLGYGHLQVGPLVITVLCATDGSSTPANAITCTRRLLAAQAAKAKPLID